MGTSNEDKVTIRVKCVVCLLRKVKKPSDAVTLWWGDALCRAHFDQRLRERHQ